MGLDIHELETIKHAFMTKLNAYTAKYGAIAFSSDNNTKVSIYLEKATQSADPKIKAAASALFAYIVSLNSVLTDFVNEKGQLDFKSVPLQPNLLVDFFDAKDYADIDSEEAQGLSELFHLLHDTFSNFVTKEVKTTINSAEGKRLALRMDKASTQKDRDIFKKELIYNKNLGLFLPDHKKETIDEALDKKYKENNDLLNETQAKIAQYQKDYRLGIPGAEEELKNKYYEICVEIKDTERKLSTYKNIDGHEQVYKENRQYLESSEFKTYLDYEYLDKEISELENQYAELDQEYVQLSNEVNNKENLLRFQEFDRHEKLIQELSDDDYKALGRYIQVKEYTTELYDFLVKQTNKNFDSLSDEVKEVRNTKQTINDVYAHFLNELKDLGQSHPNLLESSKYIDAAIYYADDENYKFAEDYRTNKNIAAKLDKKRQALKADIDKKKSEVLEIKKTFANKCKCLMPDDILVKTSFAEIGNKLTTLVENNKNNVEKIKNSEEYKNLEKQLEEQAKQRDFYNPEVVIPTYNDLLKTRTEAQLQMNRITVFRESAENLNQQLIKDNNKIAALESEIANKLTFDESSVNKNIQEMLAKYEALLNKNDRAKNSPEFTSLRERVKYVSMLFDPKKADEYYKTMFRPQSIKQELVPLLKQHKYKDDVIKQLLETENIDQLMLRLDATDQKTVLALYEKEKAEFLKRERSLYLEQLSDDLQNYLNVRGKDFVLFPDKIRKYRLALVKEFLEFTKTAVTDYENAQIIEAKKPGVADKDHTLFESSFQLDLYDADLNNVDLEQDSKLEEKALAMMKPDKQIKQDQDFAYDQTREDLKQSIKSKLDVLDSEDAPSIGFDGEELAAFGKNEGKIITKLISKKQLATHLYYSIVLDMVDSEDPQKVKELLEEKKTQEGISKIMKSDVLQIAEFYVDSPAGMLIKDFVNKIKTDIKTEIKIDDIIEDNPNNQNLPVQRSRAYNIALLNKKINDILPWNKAAYFSTVENEELSSNDKTINPDAMARYACLYVIKEKLPKLSDEALSGLLDENALKADASKFKELPGFKGMIDDFAHRYEQLAKDDENARLPIAKKNLESKIGEIISKLRLDGEEIGDVLGNKDGIKKGHPSVKKSK